MMITESMEQYDELMNALVDAIMNKDVDQANAALEQGVNPNDTLDEANVTPLHFAAQNGAMQIIPLLIHAGADVMAETEPDGYTAAEIAFIHGHEKCAQLLIAYAGHDENILQ